MKITIKTQRGGGDIEVWLNDRLACGIAAGGETVPPGWADTSTEVGRLENFASKQFRYELSLRLPLVKERNAAARYAPHWASNMMGHWEGELSIDDRQVRFFTDLLDGKNPMVALTAAELDRVRDYGAS